MTDLPIWRDDTTSGTMSAQQHRVRLIATLWTVVSVVTVMVVLGMESHGLAMQTFSGKLFLEENLRGSPAIGLPESDEDDQYYDWNVVSKTVHKNSAVTLLLSESLRGSPSIGAKPLEQGDDDDTVHSHDEFSSLEESNEEVVESNEKEDGESSIFEGMLQIWNGNYRIEDGESVDSSDEEFYDNSADDLVDSTGTAPGMGIAQA